MGKTVVIAAVCGLLALVSGLLLGGLLHNVSLPVSDAGPAERLNKVVDSLLLPPAVTSEAAALSLAASVQDAVEHYLTADERSREAILNGLRRALQTNLFQKIADRSVRQSTQHQARCVIDFAHDASGLEHCLRRVPQPVQP